MKVTRRDFLKYSGLATVAAGVGGLSPLAMAASKYSASNPLKVGVGIIGEAGEIGWSHQHVLGADAIKKALGNKVKVTVVDHVDTNEEAVNIFRNLALHGSDLVIGTSFSHFAPLEKVARSFPKTAFMCASGTGTTANLGVFECRYYEPAYVSGAAAAYMTKSNKLGFIGPFPIPDILAPGNAFLRGAQSVNPKITCHMIYLDSFNDPGKERQAAKVLVGEGCDVLWPMTDTPSGIQYAGTHGAWGVCYASDQAKFANGRELTGVIMDWDSQYVGNAMAVFNGTWKPANTWNGFASGVAVLAPLNKAIPAATVAKLEQLKKQIEANQMLPWAGPIHDQKGKLRVPKGTHMTEAQVRSMGWAVQGIIGKVNA
ncbi:MAG TPA: BMP family ABC transporter substrate-binding protein [Nevskiaceae bacterium]|nr:BMP family ABC transporter substrate-binding protein [Nevskiaceae bacterium]